MNPASGGEMSGEGEEDEEKDDDEASESEVEDGSAGSSEATGASPEGDGGSSSSSTDAESRGESSSGAESTISGSTGSGSTSGETTSSASADTSADAEGSESSDAEGSDVGDTTGPGTCPSPVLSPGDMTMNVQTDSGSRSYILHVPSTYDGTSPVPLVVDFHPLGGSGQAERNASPYPAQTDPEGVIMAFPSGLSGPSGGAWNVGPCCVDNTDDVAFARALVAQVQETACIDPKRIYAVGFSMGGGFSHYLACHAADLFAAVAPAAFDLLEENVGDCNPARPITVVSFRSTGDFIVPYEGGFSSVVSGMPITFLGAQGTHEAWAERNQCSGSSSAEDANGCSTYSDCADGTEVVLCTRQGGGHDYGNAAVGWPILREHTLP